MSDAGPRPEKIAILGGGMAALAAAFALTDQPGWEKRYEIHLYQMGWRLGGKGASGRNQEQHNRIEEHGLHVWLGFYENAFRLIRSCYAELNRLTGTADWTLENRFLRQDYIYFAEEINGQWQKVRVTYPPNELTPGQGDTVVHSWESFELALSWLLQFVRNTSDTLAGIQPAGATSAAPKDVPGWERRVRGLAAGLRDLDLISISLLLQRVYALTRSIGPNPPLQQPAQHLPTIDLLNRYLERVWQRRRDVLNQNTRARHVFLQLNLMTAILTGMLRDGVLRNGFEWIDDQDLSSWLHQHGASQHVSVESAWVRSGYDLAFGFRRGDPSLGNLAAGIAVRNFLRMTLTYKGSVAWKMRGGMGDIVFAPLYQVLKNRGVNFHFFCRVRSLHLTPDQGAVSHVVVERQARVKAGECAYDPLIQVGDLPCWPNQPKFEQIELSAHQRRQLQEAARATGLSPLESNLAPEMGERFQLVKGKDFDLVVLGIPVGALRPICAELIDASGAWARMVDKIETVATQAFQLWFREGLADLGWPANEALAEGDPPDKAGPILATYVEPLDTWADMSHLIDKEGWPDPSRPRQISYFCGTLEDGSAGDGQSEASDPASDGDATRGVRIMAEQFLKEKGARIWPSGVQPGTTCLNWDLLVDPHNRRGEARLDAQYFRANVEPSERYVLSLPGTAQYRLRSDKSGFANLFLAGDWTYTGLNAGCVEAAVMSGLRAARGICGHPEHIVAEPDG